MRIPGFSVAARIAVAGSHLTCCFRGIATKCPVGMTKLVRATKSTGASVWLYAVSGASTRDAIDKRETNDIPRMIIIQRRYFMEKTLSWEQTTRLGVTCQRATNCTAATLIPREVQLQQLRSTPQPDPSLLPSRRQYKRWPSPQLA
jgi:hypothetical protein